MRIGWWAVLGVAVVVGTVMVVTADVAAQPGTRVIVVAAGRKAGNPKVEYLEIPDEIQTMDAFLELAGEALRVKNPKAVFFSYFDDDPERPMRYLESMDSVRQIGWPSFMDGDILFIATHTPSERYPLAKEAHIADSDKAREKQRKRATSLVIDVENLPELGGVYEMDADLPDQLWRDGHVLLRGLLSRDEVKAYRDVIHYVIPKGSCHLGCEEGKKKQFTNVRHFYRREHDTVKRLVESERIARAAGQLLRADGVRLYHDAAFFKEPNDHQTVWHTDQMTVPIEDERFISIWIALTDITLEMGSLYFANGSHVHEGEWNFKNRRHEFGLQYNTGAYNDRIPLEFDISPAVEMKAGDATVHFGWTYHAAPPNKARRTREGMVLAYFADGARILPDLYCTEPGAEPTVSDCGAEMAGTRLYDDDGKFIQMLRVDRTDRETWLPWHKNGCLTPGAVIDDRNNEYTPLLWSKATDSVFGSGAGHDEL